MEKWVALRVWKPSALNLKDREARMECGEPRFRRVGSIVAGDASAIKGDLWLRVVDRGKV